MENKPAILASAFIVLASMLSLSAVEEARSELSTAFDFYADLNYSGARKRSELVLDSETASLSDKKSARLVLALCSVFNSRKRDLQYGFSELKNLYEDASASLALRLQAGLACARAAQCMQMRPGLYREADEIDYVSIYEELISLAPDSAEACFAVVYRAQEAFVSSEPYSPINNNKASALPIGQLSEKESARLSSVFSQLENFVNSYKGERKNLAALYLMLADRYVIHHRDYSSYVKYLKAALDCEITNPKGRESASFSLARAYDMKLHDCKNAEKYYREFLKQYPNSSFVPIVNRHISELDH